MESLGSCSSSVITAFMSNPTARGGGALCSTQGLGFKHCSFDVWDYPPSKSGRLRPER